MIKTKSMTPQERKAKVLELKKEHLNYFERTNNTNALYIPKMAYRPSGKDELHVSFFPSEFQKGRDIYTEFVSIEYDSEDPKRTLYLLKHNPDWSNDYEIVTSSSGFERHIVPVSKLIVINDITDRVKIDSLINPVPEIKNPDERDIVDVLKGIERALLSINQKLSK